jgi:phosphoglycolate phosphatase/pyrophosphatase PpaX
MKTKTKIKSVVFDLDGTLMSSHETIYKSMIQTLGDLNIKVNMPEEEFLETIGHHFSYVFEKFNVVVPDIEEYLKIYRGYYSQYINESRFYPGVRKTLDSLYSAGIPVSLLTTKAQDQAENVVRHFGIDSFFSLVVGRSPEVPIKPAPDSLLNICASLKVLPGETLMVGDSELDVRCGKNAGALTCGVTYGYRTEGQLKLEEPDYLIDNMEELLTLV